MRWLGCDKGVIHMGVSGIVNALWDLWGKLEKKPVWRLLLSLTPEELVNCLDFRYVTDFITEKEAIKILKDKMKGRKKRIKEMEKNGFPGYTTGTAWSGYSDQKVKKLVREAQDMGFKAFKVKVGLGLKWDDKRLKMMRELIGPDAVLMTDCN